MLTFFLYLKHPTFKLFEDLNVVPVVSQANKNSNIVHHNEQYFNFGVEMDCVVQMITLESSLSYGIIYI